MKQGGIQPGLYGSTYMWEREKETSLLLLKKVLKTHKRQKKIFIEINLKIKHTSVKKIQHLFSWVLHSFINDEGSCHLKLTSLLLTNDPHTLFCFSATNRGPYYTLAVSPTTNSCFLIQESQRLLGMRVVLNHRRECGEKKMINSRGCVVTCKLRQKHQRHSFRRFPCTKNIH